MTAITLYSLRAGDQATIRTAKGLERSGRVVSASAKHVVLNLGETFGHLAVSHHGDIVRVKHTLASRWARTYGYERNQGQPVLLSALVAAAKLVASVRA
jgi:type II secretory pathway component PulK